MEEIKGLDNEKIIKLGQMLKRLRLDDNYECIKEIEVYVLQQAMEKFKQENVYDCDSADEAWFKKAAKNKGFIEGMIYMVNRRNSFIDASDKLLEQQSLNKSEEKETSNGK